LLPPNRMRFINSTNSLIMLIDGLLKIKWRFILFTGDERIGLKYNLPMY
jgi:hypothetical protein